MWIKYNPNPVGNHVEDCVQRAMSAALDVSWDDASDIVHEFAKNMGLPEHNDAVWGGNLTQEWFLQKSDTEFLPGLLHSRRLLH